jgi:hypothetical protein
MSSVSPAILRGYTTYSTLFLSLLLFLLGVSRSQPLADTLKSLRLELEQQNRGIQKIREYWYLEKEEDYNDLVHLRTVYDYRNVLWAELGDHSLWKQIDTVFSRDNRDYLKDRLPDVDSTRMTDPLYIPAARVETGAIRVYLARVITFEPGKQRESNEILEIRVIKNVKAWRWRDDLSEWQSKSEETIPFSRAGTELRLALDWKPGLYERILASIRSHPEKIHRLPNEMFPIRVRGPFVVKDDSERDLYAALFSGFKSDSRASEPSGASSGQAGRRRPGTTNEAGRQVAQGTDRSLDISMFRATARYDDWSLDAYLGAEEMGYLYWSNGQLSVLAGYKNVLKLGLALPVSIGKDHGMNFIGPARINPRALNGIYGFTGQFDLDFGFPFALGGGFLTGSLDRENGTLTALDKFYYIPTAFQVYYPIFVKDQKSDPRNVFRIRIGYGFTRVASGHVVNRSDIGMEKDGAVPQGSDLGRVINKDERDLNSPFISLDLINRNEIHMFGITTLYNGGSLIVGAWVELFSDHLRLEGKYSTIIRERYPWEVPSTLWFSPRLRLDLGRWLK